MLVLGVDPGLTRCGIGLVEGTPGRARLVDAGVVRTPAGLATPRRLLAIEAGLEEWIARARPDVVAVETVFAQHNLGTVVGTAQAAGVAMLVAARHGLEVFSHPPSEVKAATTGSVRRLVHVVRGLTDADNVAAGYGTVTSRACLRCHADAIEGVTTPVGQTTVRMSHDEPLEAGMACTVCHAFNEVQEVGAPDRGMEVCLKCHDNQTAAATCTTCHVKSPLMYARSAQWSFAAPLLANTDPRQSCYRCHDPDPCDRCHGIRMPHPESVVKMNVTRGGHSDLAREAGVTVCFNCHDGRSTMGATDCYACHEKGAF